MWFGYQSNSPELLPSQCSDPDMPRLSFACHSKVTSGCSCFTRSPGALGVSPRWGTASRRPCTELGRPRREVGCGPTAAAAPCGPVLSVPRSV